MYAGLQELGVANGEDLKETLTNCTEPLKAIEQFQVRRGRHGDPRPAPGLGGSSPPGSGAGCGEGATRPEEGVSVLCFVCCFLCFFFFLFPFFVSFKASMASAALAVAP